MKISHRQINNFLTIVVIVGALYIAVAPYWPNITWLFRDKTSSAPYAGELRSTTIKSGTVEPLPKDNRIVIPTAQINLPILEGSGIWVIDSGGSWRKDLNTTSPKDIGNTVIIAHRFSYQNPSGGFYHLDKVKVGDKLAIYWQGEELLYTVAETKTVPESATEIENETTERTLTLYTCTPVITAENRLVVIAKPVETGANP